MITYKWTISALESSPVESGLAKVVKSVHWRYSATDEDSEKTVDIYGVTEMDAPYLPNYIPYEDLSFEIVCAWLENKINVSNLQLNLQNQLGELVNPRTIVDTNPFN